jgi:hypothetical protein
VETNSLVAPPDRWMPVMFLLFGPWKQCWTRHTTMMMMLMPMLIDQIIPSPATMTEFSVDDNDDDDDEPVPLHHLGEEA